MKCPTCGRAQLGPDTRDLTHTYKGVTIIIPKVKADYCPSCGDYVLELREASRVNEKMLELRKLVGN